MMKPLLLFITILVGSCSGAQQDKESNITLNVDSRHIVQNELIQFPFPDIPVMLTSPEERKTYLIQHYWDKFNFADTTLVNNREVTEQGFVNYISLMGDNSLEEELVAEYWNSFCSGMEKSEHPRKVCMQMVDDYLYNPNSPYYNEGLYGAYLERMLKSSVLDEARKSTLKFRLELIKRNTPGGVATDFCYYLPDGRKNTLLKTSVEGERLLLLFYDPECPSCHDIMSEIVHDEALASLVSVGKITVLSVYTEGNTDVWKSTVSSMPKGWLVAQDRQTVKDNALYDLKAMPSIYLLDKDKKVILKDTSYRAVRSMLGL